MPSRKPPSEEQLREAFTEVGDALQRAVVLSTDRVQSVFEDAVMRGRMTRRDAEELAASLMALGREQAQELRGEVDALTRSIPKVPGKVADAVDPRAKRRKKKARGEQQEEARREAARFVSAEAFAGRKPSTTAAAHETAAPPSAAPGTGDAPTGGSPGQTSTEAADPTDAAAFEDPATLTVKEIQALLPGLSPEELATLRTREAAGKARATVLKAIDAKVRV